MFVRCTLVIDQNVYDHQARGVDSTQINPVDRGLWYIVLFVLCFVLVLRESANADERYSYSSSDSIAVPSVDPQPLQPSRPMIASAAVRKAIEYEYRCTEYEYEEIRSASARCTNQQMDVWTLGSEFSKQLRG